MFDKTYHLRFALLGLLALLLGLAIIPISRLNIDNSVEIWFYEKDQDMQAYLKQLDVFGRWDYLVVQVSARHSIYDADYLAAMRDTTHALSQLANVKKVTSIANARDNYNEEDGLNYRILLDEKIEPASGEKLRHNLVQNSIYVDGLVKPDNDKQHLVLIQAANKYGEKEPYRIALVDSIRQTLAANPQIQDYAVVGTTNMNAELNRSSKRDMFIFYPAVSLFVTLFAWLAFRSLRDIVATFAVVLSAIIFAVGLMMAMGYYLNMVTIMMGAILMSLSVASVIHLITRYHQIALSTPGMTGSMTAAYTIKQIWKPCLGASLTTILGFLSLLGANVLPITLLGVFSSIGILMSFLFTLSIGPLCMVMLWKNGANRHFSSKQQGPHRKLAGVLSYLAELGLQKHMQIVLITAVLAVVLLSGLGKLKADSNYLDMFTDHTRIADDYAAVEQTGFGTSAITVMFEAVEGIESAEVFRGLMAAQSAIEALPEVVKTISPIDIIEQVDRALAEDPQHWHKGFAGYEREAFGQLLLVAEASGNDDLPDFLTSDHRQFQLAVFTNYLSGDETQDLVHRIRDLSRQHLPPQVAIKVTGIPVMWSNMDDYLFKSQQGSLLFLSVTIFVVLYLFLRSLPLALIGLLVNLLPISLILGLMGHLGVPINMATTLIGGIAMGIAVDDTIHFLWHYKHSRQAGNRHGDAVRHTMEKTGIAIVLTTLLIIGGFLVMVLSDFTPTADFGLFTSMTVLLALLCDLLALPAILTLFERHIRV